MTMTQDLLDRLNNIRVSYLEKRIVKSTVHNLLDQAGFIGKPAVDFRHYGEGRSASQLVCSPSMLLKAWNFNLEQRKLIGVILWTASPSEENNDRETVIDIAFEYAALSLEEQRLFPNFGHFIMTFNSSTEDYRRVLFGNRKSLKILYCKIYEDKMDLYNHFESLTPVMQLTVRWENAWKMEVTNSSYTGCFEFRTGQSTGAGWATGFRCIKGSLQSKGSTVKDPIFFGKPSVNATGTMISRLYFGNSDIVRVGTGMEVHNDNAFQFYFPLSPDEHILKVDSWVTAESDDETTPAMNYLKFYVNSKRVFGIYPPATTGATTDITFKQRPNASIYMKGEPLLFFSAHIRNGVVATGGSAVCYLSAMYFGPWSRRGTLVLLSQLHLSQRCNQNALSLLPGHSYSKQMRNKHFALSTMISQADTLSDMSEMLELQSLILRSFLLPQDLFRHIVLFL